MTKNSMNQNSLVLFFAFVITAFFSLGFWVLTSGCSHSTDDPENYVGSASCRECHEVFYQKWAPSHHGKAMQPFTKDFVESALTPLEEPFKIGEFSYTVDLDNMVMSEQDSSGKVEKFKFVHALGGKNLYYFLTSLGRGKLQVMPLAYNTVNGSWYDTTTSMMRHFLEDQEDEALSWRDSMLTFNTSCFGCHVSQISKNYDLETDTYKTEWREAGISCESCHGPGDAHNKAFRKAAKTGKAPKELYLNNWDGYSVEQANHACSTCHAKFSPISMSFTPGDNFYDHYDLICMEHSDFSPEGRDLGENYTFTLASMSPCVKAGKLDCVFCHTSSGRYRFATENPNGACVECHAERVKNITAHSHHPSDGNTGKCISCHMPMTSFAKMRRCDHSMRPPTPEASRLYGSKSACIICHAGKKEEWAAGFVNKWHPDSTWQKRVVYEGGLVAAARKSDWTQLPEMLEYLQNSESDAIIITSLIRLIQISADVNIWAPVLRKLAGHESPLVRSAVAVALGFNIQSDESVQVLLKFLKDERRLVRVRAVSSLSRYPWQNLDEKTQELLIKCEKEVMDMFGSMPDAWSNYYNKGNYMLDRGDPANAMKAYKTAMKLRPDVVVSFVNAAVLASRQGNLEEGIGYLRQAHSAEPEDGAVNMNLGLALAEKGDREGSMKCLRAALKDQSCRPQAAFNLAVMIGESNLDKAVNLARIAAEAQPANKQYTDAYLYYRNRKAASGR
ncbi:MAG: HEAT repeat domain-containing protein [Kiritimatiellae bacterium]|jgi:hypothetical protein|nr:HEAT repeat domain-containing protein [Kiritimatiellia bacterium]